MVMKKTKPSTAAAFLPDYEGMIDELEKKSKLTQGTMSAEAKNGATVSTGLLGSDLMLGGGLVGGRWYTFFGSEGSAKSTHLAHIKFSAVDAGVQLLGDFDYEGCVTSDTAIQMNGVDVTLAALIGDYPIPDAIGPIDKLANVDSVGHKNVKAQLYYGGKQPVTQITSADGTVLKGFRHPVLVKTSEGAVWKYIEDVVEGDTVYKRKTNVV